MLIKIEDLMPKNIINFYSPKSVTEENISLVFFAKQKPDDAFLSQILEIDGITRCLISENLFSVQFAETANKEEVKALVLAEIDEYVSQGTQRIDIKDKANLTEKAEAVADALIRPTLNRDKGDIIISSLQNNVMEIEFTGHCAGCPYAQNTLQNVIARTFKQYLPQIREIKLKE